MKWTAVPCSTRGSRVQLPHPSSTTIHSALAITIPMYRLLKPHVGAFIFTGLQFIPLKGPFPFQGREGGKYKLRHPFRLLRIRSPFLPIPHKLLPTYHSYAMCCSNPTTVPIPSNPADCKISPPNIKLGTVSLGTGPNIRPTTEPRAFYTRFAIDIITN